MVSLASSSQLAPSEVSLFWDVPAPFRARARPPGAACVAYVCACRAAVVDAVRSRSSACARVLRWLAGRPIDTRVPCGARL
eukprot:scaffold1321_cov402-Prasinococcus_capsulatus_cf.AAC.9